MLLPSRSHLLLIDDDELARAVLELHLTEAGYRVSEAESGDDAIALLEAGDQPAVDLVLSDMQMPGLCGAALASRLRTLLRPGIPLLAMSSRQPEPAQIHGFDTFLQKPFTPEQFASALDHLHADAIAAEGPGSPPPLLADRPATLDEAVFAQLASMLRPPQLSALYTLSFSELAKHLERMRSAHGGNDQATLRESAHTIKGSFGMVGARELQAIGAALEADSLSPADQTASLHEIPLAAERLRRMLTSRGLEVTRNSSGQETE